MDRDQIIGTNVTLLRGERTQEDLAAAMSSRGHRWWQTTVGKVEHGERPLRLSEAVDLCRVLDVELTDLIAPPQEAKARAELVEQVKTARVADERFREAQRSRHQTLSRLAEMARQYADNQGVEAWTDVVRRLGAEGLVDGDDTKTLFEWVDGILAGEEGPTTDEGE